MSTPVSAAPKPSAAPGTPPMGAVGAAAAAAAAGAAADAKDVKSAGGVGVGGGGGAAPPRAGTPPATLTPDQLIEQKFKSELSELVGMGIARADALDALHICGHNRDVMERVTEYVFATPQRREAIRLAELEKRLRAAEEAQRAEIERLTAAFNAQKRKLQSEAYAAFLRAVVADGYVSDPELKKIDAQRSHADISDAEHRSALAAAGVPGGPGGAAWQRMVAEGAARRDKLEVSADCAHCHNAKHTLPTDHIVLDCMHLCLCEQCAPLYAKPAALCPRCQRPARKVVKTFR